MTDDPFSSAVPRPGSGTYGEQDVRRDGLGRYLIPKLPDDWDGTREVFVDPKNNETAWTRATTFASACQDSYSINAWNGRMGVKGLSHRPDLIALAASTPISNTKALDSIVTQARDYARARASANLGTAFHQFTEAHDRGEKPEVPAPWDADLAEYAAILEYYRIEVAPKLIELQIVLDRFGVAGTFDRIVMADVDAIRQFKKTGAWPEQLNLRPVVLDIKTGKSVELAEKEITIQLWLYANADAIWHKIRKSFMPMPENIRRDAALVLHLPIADHAHMGDILVCDLELGERGAELCYETRAWRSKTLKGLIEGAGKPLRARSAAHITVTVSDSDSPVIKAENGAQSAPAALPASPAPAVPATGRKCGACGKVGHNARTCPDKDRVNDAPTLTGTLPPAPVDTATSLDDRPWCMCTSREGWTNRGDGVYVCTDCRKESRGGMMNGTHRPVEMGPTFREAEESLRKIPNVPAEAQQDDEQPDPFAVKVEDPFPSAKPAQQTMIMVGWSDLINRATTKIQLNEIARDAKKEGEWTDALKAQGLARIASGEIK